MEVVVTDFDTSYVHKKALLCAKLCYLAYHIEENSHLKDKLGIKSCLIQKIADLKYKSIQYHIYESATHQFLVIRGTDTKAGIFEAISDLMVSMNLLPTDNGVGCYSHNGYSDVGNKIITQLCKKKLIKKDKSLVVTGHSLGGAIAKYMSIHIDRPIELFTFGSPQVTSKDYYVFKHEVVESHYCNPYDWICSYPSTLYNDDRYVYKFKSDGSIHVGKIKKLGLFIPFTYMSIRTLIGNRRLFNDHAIITYINNIEKYLDNKPS